MHVALCPGGSAMALFCMTQRSAGLPPRAVKPLGGVLAGKHLRGDSGYAKPESFGQMQNKTTVQPPGRSGLLKNAEIQVKDGVVLKSKIVYSRDRNVRRRRDVWK